MQVHWTIVHVELTLFIHMLYFIVQISHNAGTIDISSGTIVHVEKGTIVRYELTLLMFMQVQFSSL